MVNRERVMGVCVGSVVDMSVDIFRAFKENSYFSSASLISVIHPQETMKFVFT